MAGDRQTLEVQGLDECIRAFNNLDRTLRRNANGELRAASKQIASGMTQYLGGGGAPQEDRIIDAVGPKSDRYVVLSVPARKPKLSGARRNSAAAAKSLVFGVEWATSSRFGGATPGGLVRGNTKRMRAYAAPRYKLALIAIMRRYGLL